MGLFPGPSAGRQPAKGNPMPNQAMPILALLLLAGPRSDPSPSQRPVSRVENQSSDGWKLAMGRWVAGEIRIREAGGDAELARLKREGEAFVLAAGKRVDLAVVPAGDSLALQLTFNRMSAAGPRSSVYLSAGEAGAVPTVIINAEPAVRVNKDFYGSPEAGPFILIQEPGEDPAGDTGGDAGAGSVGGRIR